MSNLQEQAKMNCQQCNITFETKNSKRKFCSHKCVHESQKSQTIEKICLCGLKFETRRQEQKYCSYECRNKSYERKELRTCEICLKQYECTPSNNKIVCSYECDYKRRSKLMTGLKFAERIVVKCAQCKKEKEVLKSDTGHKEHFCNKSCRAKHTWKNAKLSDKMHSSSCYLKLKDGKTKMFRSKWEACFVKDFLEKNNLNWQYEPKSFQLSSHSYTPDFYIKELDLWIEIKGYDFGEHKQRALSKIQEVKSIYNINIVYADKEILEKIYNLNLSDNYLNSLIEKRM